jgi:hypothetical protein
MSRAPETPDAATRPRHDGSAFAEPPVLPVPPVPPAVPFAPEVTRQCR